ncbi:hypothetical protein [Cyclobacterium sediminis]
MKREDKELTRYERRILGLAIITSFAIIQAVLLVIVILVSVFQLSG